MQTCKFFLFTEKNQVKTSRSIDVMALNRAFDKVAALSINDVLYAYGKARNETRLDMDPNSQKAAIHSGIMPSDCFKNSGQMYRMFAQQFPLDSMLKIRKMGKTGGQPICQYGQTAEW